MGGRGCGNSDGEREALPGGSSLPEAFDRKSCQQPWPPSPLLFWRRSIYFFLLFFAFLTRSRYSIITTVNYMLDSLSSMILWNVGEGY